jgi:hypothetical protein
MSTLNSIMTHAVIAEKFGQQFGMRISKQTISGWIKDKDKYLKKEEEEVVDEKKYLSPSSGITRTHFFVLLKGPTYREFSVFITKVI